MEIEKEIVEREICYSQLSRQGGYYPLVQKISLPKFELEIAAYEKYWKQYNPRKNHIRRQGLSLTSLDGNVSGIPDLDSLREYNRIHGVNYEEDSFRTPTPIFQNMTSLWNPLEPYQPFLGRSHLIRFGRGGYFPYHRDSTGIGAVSYRLIALLSKCRAGEFCFLYDQKNITLEPGQLYAMNTKIEHAVFSFVDGATILVLNIAMTPDAVACVLGQRSL